MIRSSNDVGSLSEVTNIITIEKINIIALCAYELGGHVAIMIVTDDNNMAKDLLENSGYEVVEEEVILFEILNKTGMIQIVTDKFREAGINMKLLYGSVTSDTEKGCLVIITDDNLNAMMLIKTEMER